jgi:hypothetical protein
MARRGFLTVMAVSITNFNYTTAIIGTDSRSAHEKNIFLVPEMAKLYNNIEMNRL